MASLSTRLREASRKMSKANVAKMASAVGHMSDAQAHHEAANGHLAQAQSHVQDVVSEMGTDAGATFDAGPDVNDLMVAESWRELREAYMPKPYRADPDETVECPKCHKMNDVDARFCDQCGQHFVGADGVRVNGKMTDNYRPEPYRQDPDENVQCPKCHKMDDLDAHFCDQCGFKLDGAKGVKVGGKLQEAARSYQQLIQLVQDAASDQFRADPDYSSWCFVTVQDLYNDYAIINVDGDLLSVPWAVNDDGEVDLGEPTPVEVTYSAEQDMTGDGDKDADDGVMAKPGVPGTESRRIALPNLREADEITKSEGDSGNFPASDYAFVPDPHHPSTWKLRLTKTPGGEPDSGIVGAAAASLSAGGFRGQKADIPAASLAAVKAKVRAAWTKANPDKKSDEMPDSIKEAAGSTSLSGDLVPLTESAVKPDGTARIKIIQPGWGTSGYYPEDVLERDGPVAFPGGTHMYIDHPTVEEAEQRPERSLRDLAAVTVRDAEWDRHGPEGPGLYAPIKAMPAYREVLNALAPYTGVSIRASGVATQGEAEGRRGPVVESIEIGHSIDFVTKAGAGGKVLELFEAAGRVAVPSASKEVDMADAALVEQVSRLRQKVVMAESSQAVVRGLMNATLPEAIKDRLAKELLREHRGELINVPLNDAGEVDHAKFTEVIKAAIEQARVEFSASIGTVSPNPVVVGMGTSADFSESVAGGAGDPDARYTAALKGILGDKIGELAAKAHA